MARRKRASTQPGVTRSMIFGSGGATRPEKQDLFRSSNRRRRSVSSGTTSAEEVKRGGGRNTKGGTRTTRSVQPHYAPPLTPSTQPLFARVGVSLCLNVRNESRFSRRLKSADGLIQRSSVDSVANPLHLLKQPPPNWEKSIPHPSNPLGPGCACSYRLHTGYRPWPGFAPPPPTPGPLRARINRREKQIVPPNVWKRPTVCTGA